jgi:hypothetical protein
MSLTINIHCKKSAAQVQAAIDGLKARHPDYYSHDFLIWDAAPVAGRHKEVPQSFGFESESCVVVALNNKKRAGPDYKKAIEIICKELGEKNCLVLFQNESVYQYSASVGQDPEAGK